MKARISLSTSSTHEFATKSSERQLKSLVKKIKKTKKKYDTRYKQKYLKRFSAVS